MPRPPQHLLNQVAGCLQDAKGGLTPLAFWDPTCHAAGTVLQVGPRSLSMPFQGYHVFVDLEPRANWSHRALSVLVPADPEAPGPTVLPVQFPPFPGEAEPPFEPLAWD